MNISSFYRIFIITTKLLKSCNKKVLKAHFVNNTDVKMRHKLKETRNFNKLLLLLPTRFISPRLVMDINS